MPDSSKAHLALAETVKAPAAAAPSGPSPRAAATLTAGGAPPAEGRLAELEPRPITSRPSAPDTEDLPPSINGRYRPIKLLGQGGMGAVYRARDEELSRDVALKFLFGGDADDGQRLLREARAQARIEHENVCKVYEVGVADGRRYIAMQLIDGESLDQARDHMTLEEKVKAIRQAALALHEAHRLTIVHRDIKPSNIMLERGDDGAYKPFVMDFGIARDVSVESMTMTGAMAGTPAYMAPEQARGDLRALDRRTDVYSLGATLYDLLAGHPPFVEESLLRLLQRITGDEAPPIRSVNRQIPEDVEAILMKCLEREPHRRYESARALSDDLQRFLDGEPVAARRRSWAYVAARRAKKHKTAVALAAAALLAVMLFAGFWIRARRIAGQQAELSRELGESVKEMQLFLRSAYQLPLHDVEREREIVRSRLTEIKGRMAEAGPAGEGPGHYALGRGLLALHEPREALDHLTRASAAGYASPDLDYALGLALGELGREAIEEAKRIEEPTQKKARLDAIDAEYNQPALRSLRSALGARLEAPAYVEGLIALYEDKPEDAIVKAREAFEKMPWFYEAKTLEGDAELAEGSRWGHDAELNIARMMEHFQRAAEAYKIASAIAASDPKVYLGECELWAQTMNSSSREDDLKSSFERARGACERAIQSSPRSDAGRLKLAFVEACFSWWIATRVHVDNAEQVLKDAIALADDVNRRRPDDPMAAYVAGVAWRADAWYALRRGLPAAASLERAATAYEEALRRDPTFLWALNDACFSHLLKELSDTFQGIDPAASLDRAVSYCDRAAKLQPNALYAQHNKTNARLIAAEYTVDVGGDPAASLELARQSIDAGKKLSADWASADFLSSYATLLEARHDLASGRDPSAALSRAVAKAREQARRDPSSTDSDEIIGKSGLTRALYLLQRGEDPTAALAEARAAFQHALDAAPMDIGYHVWRADVEILGLRWKIAHHKAAEEGFAAALAPLLPLLDKERTAPQLYRALAEVRGLRAAWLIESRKSPDADIEAGLAAADKALALNPRMATAFAARGALQLVRARAAKRPDARAEAARAAEEAFHAAVKENPTLAREVAAPLAEARGLAGGGPAGR